MNRFLLIVSIAMLCSCGVDFKHSHQPMQSDVNKQQAAVVPNSNSKPLEISEQNVAQLFYNAIDTVMRPAKFKGDVEVSGSHFEKEIDRGKQSHQKLSFFCYKKNSGEWIALAKVEADFQRKMKTVYMEEFVLKDGGRTAVSIDLDLPKPDLLELAGKFPVEKFSKELLERARGMGKYVYAMKDTVLYVGYDKNAYGFTGDREYDRMKLKILKYFWNGESFVNEKELENK